MNIIQIIPQLPPVINGLGDYSLNLARQLRQDFGIETHFIVGDCAPRTGTANRNWNVSSNLEGFSVDRISDRFSKALVSLLSQRSCDRVLLHYVGYGYARRGCPIWLADGLEQWRSQSNRRQLVTMFHEVSASSNKPWHSSFWLSSLQKNIAARLARSSDRLVTNQQQCVDILNDLTKNPLQDAISLPVFSNIGEPKSLPSLKERKRRLVVFGHKNGRKLVYQKSLAALRKISQELDIVEICDLGVSTELDLSAIDGIPIKEKGVMDAEEISSILLDSVAAFLSFPPAAYLAKSTIFAAYCAHGLIPILNCASSKPRDGLESGKHYWMVDEKNERICWDAVEEIANNANAWYQTHNLVAQAKIFAAQFNFQHQENAVNVE